MKNNIILLGAPKGGNAQLKPVLRKMAHLLVSGGRPEEFIDAYCDIPPFKSSLRKYFVLRIEKKARQENWSIQKFGHIMSVIG